ncbi:MAG: hypothetical protein ACJ8AT_26970 [Hyalangium sp.]|uniref:hypothetical protein n=1 Tax=Hyalangium sp. TaxID=2028555 RepID=UPI003899EBCE
MTGHRRGSPFIRYELPLLFGEKPPNPEDLAERGSKGKPKPRPVTTLAVGEESGTSRPGSVTTLVVGEESGSRGA